MEVRTDRRYRFAAAPNAVWAAIADVDAYQRRWPWLVRFRAAALAPGERWDCEMRPGLVPYRLRLVLKFADIETAHRIVAQVSGDIAGQAEVTLSPTADGCEVRLVSVLGPERGVVRAVSRVAPWLAKAGHDWVLSRGARQLRRAVQSGRS